LISNPAFVDTESVAEVGFRSLSESSSRKLDLCFPSTGSTG